MPNWSGRWDDARFALLYDELYPAEAKIAFFVRLARQLSARGPIRILDLGCGTGRLACELAGQGHRVTGADPAPVMLAVARRRPGAERVEWIEAGALDLHLEDRFDLAIMTGHVFQVFLEDEEIASVLRGLRGHLCPGGRAVFETRNPAARIWERWAPEVPRRIETADIGVVESHRVVTAIEGEIVTYEHHMRYGEARRVNSNRMRFVTQGELTGFLAAAGFTDVTLHGDWDGTPAGPEQPELIVVAG